MADSKRQSIAGKIATPKVGGPSKDVTDADSNLYKAVGARYVIPYLFLFYSLFPPLPMDPLPPR